MMEVLGNMFPPIIGLKLPVVKARVPTKTKNQGYCAHRAKKKAGRKNLIIV